jgi:CPA1 family monovalent cation:H+ antiporter
MAIALSTPLTFPMRDQLITLTFGVVLFTLLVSGATVEPLAHFLGLLLKNEKTRQFSLLQSKLIAENEAMESLQAMYKKGTVSQKNFAVLEKEIVSRQDSLNRRIIDLHIENASIEELQLTQARRHLLEVRKDSIMQLAREENLEPEVVEELMLGFDEKLESIDDRAEQVGRDLLQES